MKFLHIHIIKHFQDLYEEKYKTLIKEIKEQLNKLREILCSHTVRFNIDKMSVLPELIYKFDITLVKTSSSYFVDINTFILKFT